LLFSLSFSASAQHRYSLGSAFERDTFARAAGFSYDVTYGSNAINNAVWYGAVFKTPISRETMQNSVNRAFKTNHAGYDGGGIIWYRHQLKMRSDSNISDTSKGILYSFFSLGNREHIDAVFSKDALSLVALGNKSFAGKTAEIGRLQLQIMRYTQIRYALLRKTEKYKAGAGLSLLIGHQYFNAQTQEASLYTSEIGDSLHALALGRMQRTDTASKIYFDPNGLGCAIDVFYETEFDLFSKNNYKGAIGFEISDLGFIAWDNRSLTMDVDGQYAWSGFKATDITRITDSLINSQRPSAVQDQLVKHNDKGNYTTTTLPRIAMYYQERLSEKWELGFAVQHRLFAGQWPLLESTQTLRLKPKAPHKPHIHFFESVGGYNMVTLGAGATFFLKNYTLKTGFRNLLAPVLPEKWSGFNFFIAFSGGK
jgi:hypothetical protein